MLRNGLSLLRSQRPARADGRARWDRRFLIRSLAPGFSAKIESANVKDWHMSGSPTKPAYFAFITAPAQDLFLSGADFVLRGFFVHAHGRSRSNSWLTLVVRLT